MFAQLDPKWLSRFMVRCRVLYEGELKRSLGLSPLSISNNVYRVRTGQGTFTTFDSRGHVVQIENYTDLRLPRKLSVGETAFAVFEETLSVFSDVAFRLQGGGAPSLPSLVICRRSDSHMACVQTVFVFKLADVLHCQGARHSRSEGGSGLHLHDRRCISVQLGRLVEDRNMSDL